MSDPLSPCNDDMGHHKNGAVDCYSDGDGKEVRICGFKFELKHERKGLGTFKASERRGEGDVGGYDNKRFVLGNGKLKGGRLSQG